MIHFKLGRTLYAAAPAVTEMKDLDALRTAPENNFDKRGGSQEHSSNSFYPPIQFLHDLPWTATHWRHDSLLRIRIILAKWKLKRATKALSNPNPRHVLKTTKANRVGANANSIEDAASQYNNLLNQVFLRQCIRNYDQTVDHRNVSSVF